jgi:DoxX-like family
MATAKIIVSLVLALLLSAAAIRKLRPTDAVVASYQRAGVPESRLTPLALILLAGAAGLIAGLFWTPIGVAAAIALVLYFAVAIAFHIRASDTRRTPTPALLALMSAAVFVLQLA